jgi:hypothetical protein
MRLFLHIYFYINLISYAKSQKSKKEPDPVLTDLPYIACEVCESVAEELHETIADLREKAPYKKLEEIQVIEAIDAVCATTNQWIREIDIIETDYKGKRILSIDKPGGVAKCNRECATISKSCINLIEEDLDKDDLSVFLWKGKNTLKEATVKDSKLYNNSKFN